MQTWSMPPRFALEILKIDRKSFAEEFNCQLCPPYARQTRSRQLDYVEHIGNHARSNRRCKHGPCHLDLHSKSSKSTSMAEPKNFTASCALRMLAKPAPDSWITLNT